MNPMTEKQSISINSGGGGVCLMSKIWSDELHPSSISFMSNFLGINSFRLNFVPIAPDMIFNCGGLSIAFVFVTSWDWNNFSSIFNRVQKLKKQFANLYVIVVLPTKEQNDSFVYSYFKSGMELGKPTFVPVQDFEMGFEKIVKIVLSRGGRNLAYLQRMRSVQVMDAFRRVITSVPSIDDHDANSLNQTIGSIEAIAKASKEHILENTDLSADKAEKIRTFFGDPKFYLSPKIN